MQNLKDLYTKYKIWANGALALLVVVLAYKYFKKK